MRTAGQRETIWLQDGTSLEVMVEAERDLGDGYLVTYSVPEWADADGKKYFLQDYFYPKQQDYSGIIASTGMPVNYAGKTLKDFQWDLYPEKTKYQQDVVNAFLFGFDVYFKASSGLYIYSRTRGSGKTMLACLIGNEIAKRGINVKFLPITRYIQMRLNHEDVGQYEACSVLILDDLGAQSEVQDFVREFVFDLIDSRYNANKLTIFTSNMDIDHCSKDDRIASRVMEMAQPIRLPEISIREQKANARHAQLMRMALGGV